MALKDRPKIARCYVYLLIILLLLGFLMTVFHAPYTTLRVSIGKKIQIPASPDEVLVPRQQLEEVRRQVVKDIRDTWVFLRYHLDHMAKTTKSHEAVAEVDALLAETGDRLRVIQFDLTKLDRLVGLTSWREETSKALSRIVQRRIHALQHPDNCATARKLLCPTDKNAGLGSVIHLTVSCLMAAYSSGRTAVLHCWRQDRIGAVWEDAFYPLSQSCVRATSNTTAQWPGTMNSEAILFPINENLEPRPPLKPLAVPQDTAGSIEKFSDMPGAWWVGQFVKYLMRLQPGVQKMIHATIKGLNYSHPIVGIHVRRTDKKTEASYRPLEAYMKYVEDYYLSLDLASPSAPPTPRKVFLASEDPSVVTEAERKYPTYTFLWHKNNAREVQDRFTSSALKDIVTELYLLAHADYLVCTFSSNVGRLAFEWMQSFRTDASSRVVSVDTVYFYHAMKLSRSKIRFPHHPDPRSRKKGFMDVEAGQQVTSVLKNMGQNGYRSIIVPRDGGVSTKLLPDYKLQEIVDVVNVTFPDLLHRGDEP